MLLVHTIQDLQTQLASLRADNRTVGLVPTMGALHAGHASLVRRCVSENDVSVVSVFVNPTQFNNKEDLQKYPRTIERDAALLEQLGVDLVFNPEPDEMYSEQEMHRQFAFDFGGLDTVMEGKMRPGHFNGVVQVVSKLFRLVSPQRAYFGEKDFQQLAIIRRMIRLMQFSVEIIGCPIVREASGLALSSRNERLSEQERTTAVNISRILMESRTLTSSMNTRQVEQWVTDQVNSVEGLEVEYYQIVDQTSLMPTDTWQHAIGCITVYCGPVRLIDNIKYDL